MFRACVARPIFLVAVAIAVVYVAPAATQITGGAGAPKAQLRAGPSLEPVAETRLLMLGINLPSFQGMERLLMQRPARAEAWEAISGQALLIAENGNLLMLRPPHDQHEQFWLDQAAALRSTATRAARAAAEHNYERSRAGLGEVAKVCNQCHQTFRVAVRLTPFAGQPGSGFAPPSVPQAPPVPKPPTPPAIPARPSVPP